MQVWWPTQKGHSGDVPRAQSRCKWIWYSFGNNSFFLYLLQAITRARAFNTTKHSLMSWQSRKGFIQLLSIIGGMVFTQKLWEKSYGSWVYVLVTKKTAGWIAYPPYVFWWTCRSAFRSISLNQLYSFQVWYCVMLLGTLQPFTSEYTQQVEACRW